jgi:high-affinity Fe2+/Pb2+ permease
VTSRRLKGLGLVLATVAAYLLLFVVATLFIGKQIGAPEVLLWFVAMLVTAAVVSRRNRRQHQPADPSQR